MKRMKRWNKNEPKSLARIINFLFTSSQIKELFIENSLELAKSNKRELVKIIYNILEEKKIDYDIAFLDEESSIYQNIREPEEIFSPMGKANCLELSILFCIICLQHRLFPILIVKENHAFIAISSRYLNTQWRSIYENEKKNLFKKKIITKKDLNLFCATKQIRNSYQETDEDFLDFLELHNTYFYQFRTGLINKQDFKEILCKSINKKSNYTFDLSDQDLERRIEKHRQFDININEELEKISGEKISKTLEEIFFRFMIIECTGVARSKRDGINQSLSFDNALNLRNSLLDSRFIFALNPIAFFTDYEWWNDIFSERLEPEKERWVANHPITTGGNPIQKLHIKMAIDELHAAKNYREVRQSNKRLNVTEGAKLYEMTGQQIRHRYNYRNFLKQVINKSSSVSHKKNIAIIGQPGIGKTIWLQQIANYLLNNKIGLPIWIPMAMFKKKELNNTEWLKNYIFDNWLKNAAKENEASLEDWTNAFKKLCTSNSNKVWLLLDGIDELACNKPLANLFNCFNDKWLESVNIVLTLRLNLWKGNKDAFLKDNDNSSNNQKSFKIFHCTPFDYPSQVNEYIDNYFDSELSENKNKSESLKQYLEENRRLQNLSKNPLLLSLLCQFTKQRLISQFPKKQSDIYDSIVNDNYSFRDDIINPEYLLDPNTRDNLDHSLSELAYSLMRENENIKFWFSENDTISLDADNSRTIKSLLGSSKSITSLFWWALKIGWLSKVGLDSDSGKEVFAFFHTTFQEYFAAKYIVSNSQLESFNDLLKNSNYVTQEYREIFLLSFEMLSNPDTIVKSIEPILNSFKENKDQNFLNWLNYKSLSVTTSLKANWTRLFYYYISCKIDQSDLYMISFDQQIQPIQSLKLYFKDDLKLDNDSEFFYWLDKNYSILNETDLNLDTVLIIALDQVTFIDAIYYDISLFPYETISNIRDCSINLKKNLEVSLNFTDKYPSLYMSIQEMINMINPIIELLGEIEYCVEVYGKGEYFLKLSTKLSNDIDQLISKLFTTTRTNRNIGYEWGFEEKEEEYINIIYLLLEAIERRSFVSNYIDSILSSILLPTTNIGVDSLILPISLPSDFNINFDLSGLEITVLKACLPYILFSTVIILTFVVFIFKWLSLM